MPKRGIIYVVYGNTVESLLQRSVASVRRFHPQINIQVARLPADSSHLDKAKMFDLSAFDETLFLDVDTVVLGKLGFGFDQAAKFGIACCIAPCPWARRYRGFEGEVVEYNTGVIFFNRSVARLFEKWKNNCPKIDSAIQKGAKSAPRDQASFARAVADTGTNPFVLPLNWNFRPQFHLSFFGPIKIWHHDNNPPSKLRRLCEQQSRRDVYIRHIRRREWH